MLALIHEKEEEIFNYILDKNILQSLDGMVEFCSNFSYRKTQETDVSYAYDCICRLWKYLLDKFDTLDEQNDKKIISDFLSRIANSVWQLDLFKEEVIRCLDETLKKVKILRPHHIIQYLDRIIKSDSNEDIVLQFCINHINNHIKYDYYEKWPDILSRIRANNEFVFKKLFASVCIEYPIIREKFKDYFEHN